MFITNNFLIWYIHKLLWIEMNLTDTYVGDKMQSTNMYTVYIDSWLVFRGDYNSQPSAKIQSKMTIADHFLL